MKYLPLKLTPSCNKMDMCNWNNFTPSTLNEFIQVFKPEFVDVEPLTDDRWDRFNYWKNDEDTVVIKLPINLRWDQLSAFKDLLADEFDFEYIDKNTVVIRLWWD